MSCCKNNKKFLHSPQFWGYEQGDQLGTNLEIFVTTLVFYTHKGNLSEKIYNHILNLSPVMSAILDLVKTKRIQSPKSDDLVGNAKLSL